MTWLEGTAPPENGFDANPTNLDTGIAASATKHTITGLKADTSYAFAVRRVNTDNTRGDWVAKAAGVKTEKAPTKPAKPTGPEVTEDDDGVVEVSWEAVTGATGYMVQYKTPAQGYSMTTRMKEVKAPATSAEFDSDELESGTEYRFQVLAEKDGVYSDPSDEVKWTPTGGAADKPYAPGRRGAGCGREERDCRLVEARQG